MLTYHFTNDTRFKDLSKNLYSVAQYIKNNEWNHEQTLDQAKNGWFQVCELYFGLYEGANNVELILSGDIDSVIVEFVKKFQYPNPRTVKGKDAFNEEINNDQLLAPLRVLIKILYLKKIMNKEASLSRGDFIRYILLNDDIAKNKISILELYGQIENRKLDEIEANYNYYGGGQNEDNAKKRFIDQLLAIVGKLSFISDSGGKIYLLTNNLSDSSNKYITDIVFYNDFWTIDPELKGSESYQKYLQKEYIDENLESNESYETNTDLPYNIIYYGAPGTGKSFEVSNKVKEEYPDFEIEESDDTEFVFRTTLHPEYTYSDFVGQIMPKTRKDGVTYEFYPGVFTRALKKAIQNKDKNIYLILEELSRANVSAVFGDLFQLLDRKNGRSEYSISNPLIAKEIYDLTDEQVDTHLGNKRVYLPNNLFLYGTVNTNDQNVFVMDTAFKRRFEWEYISTKPVKGKNNPDILIITRDSDIGYISWHEFYQSLNSYITKEMKLTEDKQVGQFFIVFGENEERNKKQIQNKLLQYLWEDVERLSFNGKKIFSSDINNYSELYDKNRNDDIIFSNEFLNELLSEAIFQRKEEIDQTRILTVEDIFAHFGEGSKDLVNKIEYMLANFKKENSLLFHRKVMNYNAFKYFINENKNRSGFMQIEKGTQGYLLCISFRKDFNIGEIPNSKSGRIDRKNLFDTLVNISNIEEFEELMPYIEKSWREAHE